MHAQVHCRVGVLAAVVKGFVASMVDRHAEWCCMRFCRLQRAEGRTAHRGFTNRASVPASLPGFCCIACPHNLKHGHNRRACSVASLCRRPCTPGPGRAQLYGVSAAQRWVSRLWSQSVADGVVQRGGGRVMRAGIVQFGDGCGVSGVSATKRERAGRFTFVSSGIHGAQRWRQYAGCDAIAAT